jgi:hypothetical protein
VVPVGAQIGPGGTYGPQGVSGSASTITLSSFTVPPVGFTVAVTVNDTSFVVPGSLLYIDTAGGGVGLAGVLQVQSKSGNQLTLLNSILPPAIPLASSKSSGLMALLSGLNSDFVRGDNTCKAIPLASNTVNGLLKLLSGNTTDFVDGTNNCQNLAAAIVSALFTTWTPFTLTVIPQTGAITAQSSNAVYLQIGKLVIVHFTVTVSNIGTASGATSLGGFPVNPNRLSTFYIRECSVNGLGYTLTIGGPSGALSTSGGNGNPAWANGITYVGSGIYQSV